MVLKYFPGEIANAARLVERDAIQTGLAEGVIVVGTKTNGGSIHALKAAEQWSYIVPSKIRPVILIISFKIRTNLRIN